MSRRYCPILFNKPAKEQFCREEECEWYIAKGGQKHNDGCVVREFAILPHWFWELTCSIMGYLDRKKSND